MDYPYEGIEFSTEVARYLIPQLFSNQTIRNDIKVKEALMSQHIESGGRAFPRASEIGNQVYSALIHLKAKGRAYHPNDDRFLWRIEPLEADDSSSGQLASGADSDAGTEGEVVYVINATIRVQKQHVEVSEP